MKPPTISQLLKEAKIKSMAKEGGVGSTGEAHLATFKGKKYLLRICENKETAERYIKIYNHFKKHKFFPKILEAEGKYILFEFIEGRTGYYKNENPKVISQIGKICGLVNKVKAEYDYQKKGRFYSRLKSIEKRKVLSKEKLKEIENFYKKLDKKVKLQSTLEAGDVTEDNFIINKKGKVYFVDIEAVKPNIKGLGISKAFNSWFKKEKEQEAFTKGYNSVNSMKFYTEDYHKMATLAFFIQRINYKSEKGEMDIVKKTIDKLNKLIE